jgi:hypothetical protein
MEREVRAVSAHAFGDQERAVRAACALEWRAGVVARQKRRGGEWVVVCVDVPVFDDQRVLDEMRRHPYDEWDEAYARLVRKYPPTARFTTSGLVASGEGAPRVARGVPFWRAYYGAPALSNRQLIKEHFAAREHWSIERTRAVDETSAYARRVGALTAAIAEAYARWLKRRGRVLDAERTRAAFAEMRVLVLPDDAHLDGALYPLHAVLGVRPAEDLRDNRRCIAVKRLDDAALRALLAHEVAHAQFPPVWQRENHPPAFSDAETELRAIVGKLHVAPPERRPRSARSAEGRDERAPKGKRGQ